MKKGPVVTVIAFSLCVFLLAGCGNSSSSLNPTKKSPTEITLYASGDTNIQQLWDKVIIPAFELQYPSIKVNDVFLTHKQGQEAVLAKLKAAKEVGNSTNDIDLYEGDPGDVALGGSVAIWQKISPSAIPNLSSVQAGLLDPISGYAVPYRASSVVLAYNSKTVPNPPRTFDELIQWIRNHPGRFTYNDPSAGGSGRAFVVEAIYKYDYPISPTGYDQGLERKWTQGFTLLKSLNSDMYQKGVYPTGNQDILNLLANGDIDMGPVWSDMALSALDKGTIPNNIKLIQITPGFVGGGSYLFIPSTSVHKKDAYTFINFVLSPATQTAIVRQIDGYPAIDWSLLPSDLQSKFAGISGQYRYWPGQYNSDLVKMWQQVVPG